MRIILATGIFPPDIGGPAIYTEKLAKAFRSKGIEIQIICCSDVKKYRNYNFPVVRISRKIPKILRHLLYFLKLFKIAKRNDIIYAQNSVTVGFPAMSVSKILNTKFVLKIVGDSAWERGMNKWKIKENLENFQNKKYGQRIEFLRKVQKYVAKNADEIIVPSYYLKEIITKGWEIPESKVNVIYNAAEGSFLPEISEKGIKQKIGIDGDIILSVGRLVPWKGFGVLIEMMLDLLKENSNFQLVIVGDGPERERLKFKVKGLNLENKVKFLGSIDHSQIPLYFQASKLFVLNTGYEGLSHVILEAMQAGIPIITTNVGGNPELIENKKNGILVEYNNGKQLKEAIIRVYQDKELQNKFIQNSKEKLKEFTFERMIEKTLNVLKS